MTADTSPTRGARLLLAAAALLGAWLLFQVQPMVAKRLLPWYGGGTAIWTTTLLFFQTALLGGYLYAHLLVSRVAPRRQAAVHTMLLLAATIALALAPVLPSEAWQPTSFERPGLQILATLAACVGLPYVMLAATAPLVQSWYAQANPGRTPYRLYALSNFGSLAALVSYPLLVEPQLGVARQGVAWSVLFGVFAVICAASGWNATRAASSSAGLAEAEAGPIAVSAASGAASPLRSGERFFWFALPMCASAALLTITAHLCQDVVSIPLLWIAPLVTYLLTFIVAFERDRWYQRWFWLFLLAASSFVAVGAWRGLESTSFALPLAANLVLLLAIGMVCHGELARMRPAPQRLTAFYLAIAAGGALGGAAIAIVAPLAFNDTYELPLSILAAWVLAVAVLVTDRESKFYDGRAFKPLLGIAALLIALAVAMLANELRKRSHAVATGRNFYGTLKVREIAAEAPQFTYYKLNNGAISHGTQYLAAENRRFPSQYYHSGAGVGMLLSAPHTAPRRIGVVGLGVGTLAAYAEAGDLYEFYEINPQVVDFAEKYFTFLSDARDRFAKVDVVPGDARLSLARQEPQNFDLLALDAFTSDAVPAHLLTREAFVEYLRHLRNPDGVLAVHISHRYLDLALVVKAAAEEHGLAGFVVDAPADGTPAGSSSRWVLLFRPEAKLAAAQIGVPLEDFMPARPPVLWTDDYNNILGILKSRGG
jgi:SAM-dependent methyltransferase